MRDMVRVLSVAGFARRFRLKRETRPVTELHDGIPGEFPRRERDQPFTVDPGALARVQILNEETLALTDHACVTHGDGRVVDDLVDQRRLTADDEAPFGTP